MPPSEIDILRSELADLRRRIDMLEDTQNDVLAQGIGPRLQSRESIVAGPSASFVASELVRVAFDAPNRDWATGSHLYAAYLRWAGDHGIAPTSPPRFAAALKAAGFIGKHSNAGTRYPVKLRAA